MNEPFDQETLVAGLRRGDTDAQQHVLQQYGESLVRFLIHRCGADPIYAEDIAVEAMYRAVFHIDKFVARSDGAPNAFRNWLFKIARNLWYDQQRRRLETVYLEQIEDVAAIESSATDRRNSPAIQAVREALAALPDKQRQTLLLHYGYGQLPLTQIAEILDARSGTVRQWKQRGLSTLKQRLRNHPALAYVRVTAVTTQGEES